MCLKYLRTTRTTERTPRTAQRMFNTLSAHLTLSNAALELETLGLLLAQWTAAVASGGGGGCGWRRLYEEWFTLARITRAAIGLT